MKAVQKQENKLRSDLREAAWKFEVVRSWAEEELDKMAPVSVAMYTSARVFSQLKEKDLQNLQKPRWVKEKVSLVLQDIYRQGKEKEKEEKYSNAGRPSILSPLRRKAAQDWTAYCIFQENTKEDYLKGHFREENLLLIDNIDEEQIYNNIIYPFLEQQITQKRRQKEKKEKAGKSAATPLFPAVHNTSPESPRKEDHCDE